MSNTASETPSQWSPNHEKESSPRPHQSLPLALPVDSLQLPITYDGLRMKDGPEQSMGLISQGVE